MKSRFNMSGIIYVEKNKRERESWNFALCKHFNLIVLPIQSVKEKSSLLIGNK